MPQTGSSVTGTSSLNRHTCSKCGISDQQMLTNVLKPIV